MTSYVVVAETGEYSDYSMRVVRVFDNSEQAEAFSAKLNRQVKENPESNPFDDEYYYYANWKTRTAYKVVEAPFGEVG